MSKTKIDRNIFFAVLFLMLLVIILSLNTCKKQQKQSYYTQSIITALQSGLKKSIDKQGRETAEKTILVTKYSDLKKMHVSDSSTIGRLKNIINKTTSAAVIIKNTTSGTLTGTNVNVSFANKTDSTGKKIIDSCNVVFKDTLIDQWTNLTVYACKDSVKVDFTIKNEYEQTQELGPKIGKWPFKYREPIIKVKNLNKHTKTNEISAWAVQVPNHKKRLTNVAGIAIITGFVLGVVLVR